MIAALLALPLIAAAPQTGSPLANSEWRIDMVDGRKVTLDRAPTLAFTADRMNGRVCNGFGGNYRVTRGTLTAQTISTTRMACPEPVMRVEAAVLRALGGPLKVHQGSRGDTLVLAARGSSLTLRRVVAAEPSLADTRWSIAAIDGRPVALDPRVNDIRFTADRISGKAGCNSFGGTYRFARGMLTTAMVISTQMACPPEIMRVETAFHRAIASPMQVKWTGRGETLTLAGRSTTVTLKHAQ